MQIGSAQLTQTEASTKGKRGTMDTSEYLKSAEELFLKVESKMDEFEDDIDYDKADGKIQIIFENGSSPIVVNRQRALHEIWLAGGARAWHFKWIENDQHWYAQAEAEEFFTCLSTMIKERIQKPFEF